MHNWECIAKCLLYMIKCHTRLGCLPKSNNTYIFSFYTFTARTQFFHSSGILPNIIRALFMKSCCIRREFCHQKIESHSLSVECRISFLVPINWVAHVIFFSTENQEEAMARNVRRGIRRSEYDGPEAVHEMAFKVRCRGQPQRPHILCVTWLRKEMALILGAG